MAVFDLIFVLLHPNGNHFTLLIIDKRNKSIEYYDSLIGRRTAVKGFYELNRIFRIIDGYHERVHGHAIDDGTSPQQNNGIDCGVFTSFSGRYKTEGFPKNFSQNDIQFPSYNVRRNSL